MPFRPRARAPFLHRYFVAKPVKHRNSSTDQRPASPSAPALGISTRLILVWGWLAIYLAAYFLWPLTSGPLTARYALRRGHLWLALLLGDETFGRWFEGIEFSSLVERGQILAAAAAIFTIATAAGWIGLRLFAIDRRLTRVEQFVFSAGVGLNLVSLATLALGLAGALRSDVFISLGLAIVLIAAVIRLRSRHPEAQGNLAETWRDEPATMAMPSVSIPLSISPRWLWLAVPFFLVLLGSAMLPPFDFDVREYHLQAPKEFFQAGRITFLPHNVYANMPLGTEMLSLAAMVVTGDWWIGALVGKTLIACFAPLTALTLYAAGRRLASASVGVLAALLYISIPWVALVSTQGLVEGAFAFYLLAAYYAILLWRGGGAGGSWRLLVLAGFLAGGAVATKYPGVVYSVLPLAAYVVYASLAKGAAESDSRRSSDLARSLATILLACAAGCGLWFAKNAVLTGNPAYPLLYSWFDGETRTPEKDAQWSRAHRPPKYDPADLTERLVQAAIGSDWLSPLVFPLAALALFRRPARRLTLLSAGYLVYLFAAWWLFTHRIDRFLVPALPLAALLAGIGAAGSNSPWWRGTLAVLMGLGLAFSFIVIAAGQLVDNRYLTNLDSLGNDPQRVEPWHLYLNAHADDVGRVLLVGDATPLDLQVPATYNTVFDDSIFERLARGRTPAEVSRALDEMGISHVYVSWREIDRYRSPGNYGITSFLQPQVFDDLVAQGVLERLPAIGDDSGEMFRVGRAKRPAASSGR